MALKIDKRNCGGRDEINNQLKNHYLSILEAKSTFKKNFLLQGGLSKLNKRHIKLNEENALVNKTYQSILNMNQQNETFWNNIQYQKKYSKPKSESFYEHEHIKNLNNLEKKISKIGTVKFIKVNERKRDRNNPNFKPSLFFRPKSQVQAHSKGLFNNYNKKVYYHKENKTKFTYLGKINEKKQKEIHIFDSNLCYRNANYREEIENSFYFNNPKNKI